MRGRKRWIVGLIVVILICVGFYLFWATPLMPNGSSIEQQVARITQGVSQAIPFRAKAPETAEEWDAWIERQVEKAIRDFRKHFKKEHPSAQPLSEITIEEMRKDFRANLRAQLPQIKKEIGTPTQDIVTSFTSEPVPLPRYAGPQTVEAILSTYAASYNLTWETEAIAEKYPQAAWIQMLLDRGIAIEDSADFFWYQEPRRALAGLENDPEAWASGAFAIPPTDNWETYEAAYIERRLWEEGMISAARKADPAVGGGIFVGADKRIFHPLKSNRIYVHKEDMGATFYGGALTDAQEFELLFKGVTPANYEVIYIGDDGHILSAPPPLITREEMLDAIGALPVEGEETGEAPTDVYDVYRDAFVEEAPLPNDRRVPGAPPAATAQPPERAFQQAQQATERALETLTKSDADILKDLQERLPTDENIEEVLRQRFSADRLNRAASVLNRYGPEEGLQRLKESDAEMATYLGGFIRRSQDSEK